ncbi:MAG: dienelactone hydrolase family protein [Acidobacteriaceae bacterium]|nr:dienelactone hydrolase family protein [Acidobacteriaceae bacterium]
MCKITSFEEENVGGFVHEPAGTCRGGLALTHGAGGNCNAKLVVAVADAFCADGWTVLRYNLPFRRQRPFGPPMPKSAAMDQEGVRVAVEKLRGIAPVPIVAAGHSYGGRQTTMLAANDPKLCDAIVAFSYPLHPPNKPDQLRTAHFAELKIPLLFVHGSSDAFGTVAEMQSAIAAIPSRTRLVIVEGARHDLRSGKFDITGLVIGGLNALLE